MSSLPDSYTGIMCHTTCHHSLGPFYDTLVLWRFSDPSSCCEQTHRSWYSKTGNWFHLSLNVFLKHGESCSIADGWSILQGFQGLIIKIYAQKICESLDYTVRIS